jgi:dienelactone hydrolase
MTATPFEELGKALGFGSRLSPEMTRENVLLHLGKMPAIPANLGVAREEEFEYDGVRITTLSWKVGWGKPTEAFLLTPIDANDPLPGVLYLHSHDDLKEFGKEKVAQHQERQLPERAMWVRREHYGDRAPANELAKRGFAVLVHDSFPWGSRGFSLDELPPRIKEIHGTADSAEFENLSVMFESLSLNKYLSLYGATMAGILNFDDRVALEVAKSLPEISGPISAIGLSGGGCRALFLHATNPELRAVVSTGAMATYASMLHEHITPHSWMFFPFDLASKGEWPQIGMISDTPLFVQYCGDDQLFTKEGMADAHTMLAKHDGGRGNYRGEFYPVKHSFTVKMQEAAFDWLAKHV